MNQTNISTSPVNTIFDQFFNRNIGQFVGADSQSNTPAANIIEEDDQFRVHVAAPGFKKEDFNILLDKNQLKVSVKKEESIEELKENFRRREFNYESFERKFTLPETVDYSKIEASYNDGILNINIAKKEEAIPAAPKQIEIK